MDSAGPDITRLLLAWRNGEPAAAEELVAAIYSELRNLAGHRLQRESREHTLQPTELVHEAFLRVADASIPWQDRKHFFAVVATTMRRVLVDHARKKGRDKRGRNPVKVTLSAPSRTPVSPQVPAVDLLDLDAALEELSALDPAQVRLVELYYFTGLTLDEISEATGMARSSAHRLIRSARAWIHQRLSVPPSGAANGG